MRRARRALALIAVLVAVGAAAVDADTSPPSRPSPAVGGDFPDPTVVGDANRWLAFATATGGHRIPVMSSVDLRSWESLPDALDGVPSWAIDAEVWAPGVARIGDRWRLYYAAPRAPDGIHCLSVASADAAAGPYHDSSTAPLVCQPETLGSIDPEPFVAADGTPWLVWKSQGHPEDRDAALWSAPLSADGLTVMGAPTVLLTRERDWERPLIENPSMARWRGRYLLTYSAGLWQGAGYSMGYAVCDSPQGPCARVEDGPVSATTDTVAGPGGGSLFTDAGGRLTVAFHAWSPGAVGYEQGGRRSLRVVPVAGDVGGLRLDGSPIGALDTLEVVAVAGVVVAKGWSIDPDGAVAAVSLVVDGRPVMTNATAVARPDVGRAHPGFGPTTGFTMVQPIGPGSHRICAVAVNAGLGRNRELGCRQVATPTPIPAPTIPGRIRTRPRR